MAEDGLLSSLTQVVDRSDSWVRSSFRGVPPSPLPSLQEDLARLRRMLPRIRAVLDDAEEMEIQDESVKLWLREIKDVAYDADDVLDEYEYELLRAKGAATTSSLRGSRRRPQHLRHGDDVEQVIGRNLSIPPSSMDTSFWGKIACRVQDITERFGEISKQRDGLHLREGVGERRSRSTAVRPPSTPLMDGPNIYGREVDIKKLMSSIFSPGEHNPSVIAVAGMGGVGKTTLAQHVYNDQAVCEYFELRGWVCVSDHDFEVPKLTKRIIEAITRERCDLNELSVIQEKLMKELSGRRFLLVLDDLWNQRADLWRSLQAPLRYGSQGSTIITTTRSEKVAKATQTMPCLSVGCLPFDDCWAIFQQHAFGGQAPEVDEDRLEVGKKMVRKCKGLPLACTTLGGLLRYESDIHKWNEVLTSEIWDFDGGSRDTGALPTLMLSYIHLPTHLKRCFAYCAVFPKDFSFTKDQLVRLWMAQGFIQFHKLRQLEETGIQYFDELSQRSFFQPSHEYSPEHEQGFGMHDLIHDLAVSLSGGECSRINNEETWRPSYESRFLRHIAFVPGGSDVSLIFQSLCDDGLGGLRSLLLVRRTDVWVKKEVVNEIPDAVMLKLVCLRALDLSYIRLRHLPDSIGNLKHLRYLDLSRTRIEVFPESLCQLYLLQTVDLSYARIEDLPDSISNLTELRYLSLCHTGLRTLPATVGELINLRTLDLAYTDIRDLPQTICNLRHLTFLDVSGTKVRRFPEPVCMLSNLRTLNLNNVSIYEIPDSIGNLQNLHHLNLNETGIGTLPESICNLRYLRVLNLSFSAMRELPQSIGNLVCLTHLDLSNTHVERLPHSICGISNLQSLLLKSCSVLRGLPEDVGRLTNLQHLDFNAQGVYMPRGIGRLTNLRTLSAFNVGGGQGDCSIEELTDLSGLRGSLQISGLSCVEKPEIADMVNLRAKTQIDKLTLSWEGAPRRSSLSSEADLQESSLIEEVDRTFLGEQQYGGGVLSSPVPVGDTAGGGIISREGSAPGAQRSDVREKFQPRDGHQELEVPSPRMMMEDEPSCGRRSRGISSVADHSYELMHHPGGVGDLTLSQSGLTEPGVVSSRRWSTGGAPSSSRSPGTTASQSKQSYGRLKKLQRSLIKRLHFPWWRKLRRRRGGVQVQSNTVTAARDDRTFCSESSRGVGSEVVRTPPSGSGSGSWGRVAASPTEQSDVLEKLQPHGGLAVLEVLGFGGNVFPRWMEDPSFARLVQLVLRDCSSCTHLPALGQLPSLKQLTIIRAPSVERLGPEFRSSCKREGGGRGAFPSLEVMRVEDMSNWVEWWGVEDGDFPRLAWLEITACPSLRGDLPNSRHSLPMLKVLKLEACQSLVCVPLHNVPNLRTAEIQWCEKLLHIDFVDVPRPSSSSSSPSSSSSSTAATTTEMGFRSLRISGCPHACFLPGEGHLLPRTLTHLRISSDCGRLLEWCQGDGEAWLSQVPNTRLWRNKELGTVSVGHC